MRVLLLTPAFPPEITGSGHLYYELAESLVANGHTVTVITALPRQRLGDQKLDERYKRRLLLREEINGIQVVRVATLPLPLTFRLTKGLDHFTTPLAYLIGGLFSEKQDVILAYSPPLPLGLTAYALARRQRIPFVLNAQDMVPQYGIDLGLLNNSLAIKLFRAIGRFLYRHAPCIVVHSEGNRRFLASRGVEPKKLVVISNWADTERIVPGPKDNSFREEHGLNGQFIVSYAGTIGWAQDLDTVIESAAVLRSHQDIRFVLVGDGPKRRPLQAKAGALGLDNVTFLPLQPRDRYPLLLHASDVCLISLSPRLTTPVVPGKLFDIMASGRPVVGDVPLDGDAPKIVAEGPCGICVDPGDPDKLAEAILKLYRDPALAAELGANGRRLVERKYSRSICTRSYEQLLLDVACRKTEDGNVPLSDFRSPSSNPAAISPAFARGKRLSLAIKRAFDIVGALALLVLFSPLLLVIAIAIKLDIPGPVFYKRRVIGQGGKPFMAFKFRSMVANAHELLTQNPALLQKYQQDLKIAHDPRVTRVGRILRKTTLDELPQLINVLKGEMSLVGPRMLGDVELASFGEYGDKVLSVKPGMAGLWVASGRHTLPFERRVELEVEYVDRWSLWLDIKILLKSALAVIKMVGAE